jgi:hypothetical protein
MRGPPTWLCVVAGCDARWINERLTSSTVLLTRKCFHKLARKLGWLAHKAEVSAR